MSFASTAATATPTSRSRWWPLAGLALHAANGAAFGLAFDEVRRRTGLRSRPLALTLALAEHIALYPLSYLVDTRHPARGEPGLAPLFTPRGFAQATARHALFGALLGRWAAE